MNRLHLIKVVAVVHTNGFAGAARKLGVWPPAVTRAITELETSLGVRLLTRTTRIVSVTELVRATSRIAGASWANSPRPTSRWSACTARRAGGSR